MKTQGCAVQAEDLWHQRMGHPSKEIMSVLLRSLNCSSHVDGQNKVCDVCFWAKQTRNYFPISDNKAKELFEIIHCDIWGPYRLPSSCRAHYFFTIVDDFSRGVWVFLMKGKSEAGKLLKGFVALVKTQFDKVVKIIRTDNGLEFVSGPMKMFYLEAGIVHQTSCVDTPQQNGRMERKHRYLLNVARALRFPSNLPLKFWGECVLTAAHLINRTSSKLLKGKTPYEMIFNENPSYDSIKVFGCLCFAINKMKGKDTFASRSQKCIFVGYPFGKKGWRLYDFENHEFLESRDVIFFEHIFPFVNKEQSTPTLEDNSAQQTLGVYDDLDIGVQTSNEPQQQEPMLVELDERGSLSDGLGDSQAMDQNPEPVGVNKSTSSQQFSDSPSNPVREFAKTGPAYSTEPTPLAPLSSIESNVGGREQHNRRPPTRLNDYVL